MTDIQGKNKQTKSKEPGKIAHKHVMKCKQNASRR